MKITFLGTGTSQGVPVIGSTHPVCLSDDPKDKRLRCSAMVSWDDFNYVIDCGPDFRQQMLRANVSHINGILLTHEHTDHIIGLDDIRPFFYKERKDIPLFGLERVLKAMSKRFHYIFESSEKYPGTPNVQPTCINASETVFLGGKKIQPIDINHGRLPILGYRFNNLVYLTDVKTLPEHSFQHLKHVEILVINALREEDHPTHLTLQEALDLIKIIQPKKAYISHISHLLGFHKEVEAKLPPNIHLAYDGLEIEMN